MAKNNETSLVVFEKYDPALLCNITDVHELFQERGLCSNTEELFVRSALRLFAIQPHAQHKPEPKVRGKGEFLYLRSEVLHVLETVVTARGINS